MNLNPEVWGPHYWFMLHTIALSYPKHPNAVTKKKYYDFISNIPLFIPVEEISTNFSKLLDLYPVTPYLDFLHNKINEVLQKPKISLHDFYANYYDCYKPTEFKIKENSKWKGKLIYTITILSFVFLGLYLYKQ